MLETLAGLLVNGAANFGNALIGNYFNNKSASRANKYALYMSNTAHQREVADLQAAGLNPVLSALGSGASTVATPVASSGDDFQRAQSDTINSAWRSALKKEQEQADAVIKLTEAQTATERANSAYTAAQTDALKAQMPSQLLKSQSDALNAAIKYYWEYKGKGWFDALTPAEKSEVLLRKQGINNWRERIAHQVETGSKGLFEGLTDWILQEEVEESSRPVAGARAQANADEIHRQHAANYLERAEHRRATGLPKEKVNAKMWRDFIKPLLDERRREDPSYLKGYL